MDRLKKSSSSGPIEAVMGCQSLHVGISLRVEAVGMGMHVDFVTIPHNRRHCNCSPGQRRELDLRCRRRSAKAFFSDWQSMNKRRTIGWC